MDLNDFSWEKKIPKGPQGVLRDLKGSYGTSRGLKGHQGNLRDLKLESSSGSEGHQGVL